MLRNYLYFSLILRVTLLLYFVLTLVRYCCPCVGWLFDNGDAKYVYTVCLRWHWVLRTGTLHRFESDGWRCTRCSVVSSLNIFILFLYLYLFAINTHHVMSCMLFIVLDQVLNCPVNCSRFDNTLDMYVTMY